MTAAIRPLVLDAGSVFAPDASEERDIAGMLVGRPGFAALVQLGRRGLQSVSLAAIEARRDTLRTASPEALAVTRRWLIDGGERPVLAPAARRTSPVWLPRPRPKLPSRAALIRVGFAGWSDPAFAVLLDGRPDLATLAVIGSPTWLDWPEYEPADEVAARRHDLAALGRRATVIAVPDAAARARLLAAMADRDPATLLIEPPPSVLAETDAPVADAALAAVPYMIAPGPIEARANSLLLLQLWRSLTQEGTVPKLVLAGARGRQIEEIKPLLDWNPTLARHVIEAPHLPPQALRHLMTHARAVLYPAFVEQASALTRDAAVLGLPIIAAGPADGALVLSPIDGRGWLAAIRAHAGRPAGPIASATLADSTSYAERIARKAATLA